MKKLYRPSTILIGVLFVLIGGVARLADPDHVYEESNLKVVHGTIGQALDYAGGDSTVKVTRIRLAQSVISETASSDDKPLETNGVYVAVEWDAVRGEKKPDPITATLLADGGSVYEPISQVGDDDPSIPDAGFARTGVTVFEVNPADMKGLTLRLRSLMVFNYYNSEIRVDLGIPTEEIAQQMVDKAAPRYVAEKSVTRVAS